VRDSRTGFNTTKTIPNNLGYRKLCARRVPQMLTPDTRSRECWLVPIFWNGMRPWAISLSASAAYGRIRKWEGGAIGWKSYESHFLGQVRKALSFWISWNGDTINSACHVVTLKKLNTWTARVRPEKKFSFSMTMPLPLCHHMFTCLAWGRMAFVGTFCWWWRWRW
jgi:hypothetical protein